MSMTFTKLFSSITASTIWAARDQTRILWITMLAMADQHGRVWASIPGLANIARVSLEDCEKALEELAAPDKYSRTKDNDGRRIEEIDGGWRLLNHAKYRAIRDEESIKESKRRYINNRRAAERKGSAETVDNVEQSRHSVDRRRANTEADTEAEAVEPKGSSPAGAVRASGTAKPLTAKDLQAHGIDPQHAADWLALRKAKRLPLTPTAWADTVAEGVKAGLTPAQTVGKAVANNWAGFKASWLAGVAQTGRVTSGPSAADPFAGCQ